MKNTLERVIAAVLFVGVALLFVLGLVAFREFRALGEKSQLSDRFRSRLVVLQGMNRALLSAESGQRGFLLTSNPTYLDSYTTGVTVTKNGLSLISRDLSETPGQRSKVQTFSNLANNKLEELQETIDLERNHRHADALRVVQTGVGKRTMEQIQAISASLISDEREQLAQLNVATDADRLFTARLFEMGEVGLILLFANTFLFVRRALRTQAIAEETLVEKERFLKTIADSLPVLISYTDSNEVVQFSNLTHKTWLDHDPADDLGRTLAEVMGEELYTSRRDQIRSVLTGKPNEFLSVVDLASGRRQHKVLYLPDLNKEGKIAGFFSLTTDITEMKDIEWKLQEQAHLDLLTGLPNRRQFQELLQEHLSLVSRDFRLSALLFLDIDHFKTINDTYGHGIGDAVLKHFGGCLREAVRSTDIVARLAGDEFVVLLRGLQSRNDVDTIAEKVLSAIRTCFKTENHEITITASIGGAFANQANPTEKGLFTFADKALYDAKRSGRNCFRLLDCDID